MISACEAVIEVGFSEQKLKEVETRVATEICYRVIISRCSLKHLLFFY